MFDTFDLFRQVPFSIGWARAAGGLVAPQGERVGLDQQLFLRQIHHQERIRVNAVTDRLDLEHARAIVHH